MTSKKLLIIGVSLAGLVILAAIAHYAFRVVSPPGVVPGVASGQAGKGSVAVRPAGPPGGMAVSVETATVTAGPVREEVSAVGTSRSNESVVVRPEISGRIARIEFDEGKPVRKGQLLVALDDSVYAAELQQAKANLALQSSNYERTVELARDNFVSANAKDQALNNLRVAEASLALAQARLAKTRIQAPFSGIVGIRQVSIGDYVKEGQDLATLEDISSLKVDFRIPELYLTSLRRGQSVEVQTDAFPGKTYVAVLDAIDPLVDQNGRSLVLRARLKNLDGALRPGMFVRTRLIIAERPDALTIPEEALVPVGSSQYVFRVSDGKAERVKVETGVRRRGRVEIVSGLAAGDVVVTAGQIKLRDGVPVRMGTGDDSPGAPAKVGKAAPPERRL
ncbi:MAG: efflux RND transporter periplasmic adaptor subunit [Betaproteobacteria bacterium]|jgi:membrane fusion protein (multidrug efflux system)|nr:efflux RND transporter periplasmic adaptor subunit [Betaproteobacteria bacterium]